CSRLLLAFLVLLGFADYPGVSHAEEAATGHYLPGAMSSFIDMLPDRGTSSFVYANAFTYYHGSVGGNKELEFGGLLTANAKGTAYSDTSLFLYQAPVSVLEGQYGASVIVPYVWLEVEGNVVHTGKRGKSTGLFRDDAANGFGDVEILPVMMGWKLDDLKLQGQFAVYAPTGSFSTTDLANIGRNYWTFEPAIAASYLSTRFGLEFTTFVGFDFNTKNEDTEYQT